MNMSNFNNPPVIFFGFFRCEETVSDGHIV